MSFETKDTMQAILLRNKQCAYNESHYKGGGDQKTPYYVHTLRETTYYRKEEECYSGHIFPVSGQTQEEEEEEWCRHRHQHRPDSQLLFRFTQKKMRKKIISIAMQILCKALLRKHNLPLARLYN